MRRSKPASTAISLEAILSTSAREKPCWGSAIQSQLRSLRQHTPPVPRNGAFCWSYREHGLSKKSLSRQSPPRGSIWRLILAPCPAIWLANAYFMGQRFHEARITAMLVIKAEPGNSMALKIKGNAEYLSGEANAAINTFVDLLERHPEDGEAAYMLGRIYYQESMVDQAIGQFERVLKTDPRSYKSFDNLGLCYEAKGDNDKATRYFLTAIKIVEQSHATYDWPYANLSDLLFKTGDPERAYDAASKAANMNPLSARNFYLGGKALEKLGKTDLALNWLERSTTLDPAYPEPEYLLAQIYHRLGEQEKADAARKRFLAAKALLPATRR